MKIPSVSIPEESHLHQKANLSKLFWVTQADYESWHNFCKPSEPKNQTLMQSLVLWMKMPSGWTDWASEISISAGGWRRRLKKVIWVSGWLVQTSKWGLTWPNFCVSEQAKVVILFLAKISPLVPWIAGGGTRNLAGSFKSPSYCIMPTNFVCINSHAPSLITYLRWLDPSLI